ncbi:MAG: serine hydrolase domain-containing protein, partial [Nannocystaceae bacterium]
MRTRRSIRGDGRLTGVAGAFALLMGCAGTPGEVAAPQAGTPAVDPVAPIATSEDPAVATSRIGEILERVRAEHEVPALGAAILTSGGVALVDVSGVRHRRKGGTVTTKERWHLGSNGKAMTATLIAQLVESSDVAWDSPIAELFGEGTVDEGWREVTVQMLLDHRGGLPANLPEALVRRAQTEDVDSRVLRAEWVRETLAEPPIGEVGEYAYSNAGYTMLGALLESRWDATFWDLLTERLLTPLKMEGCGFGGPGSDNARGHVFGVAQGAGADNPDVMAPAGTVHCPLASWGEFVRMHLRAARGEPMMLK